MDTVENNDVEDEQSSACVVQYNVSNTLADNLQSFIVACTEKFFAKQKELIHDVVRLENDGAMEMDADTFETFMRQAVRLADYKSNKSSIHSGSAVYMSRWGTTRPDIISEVLTDTYSIGPRVLKQLQQSSTTKGDSSGPAYINLIASFGNKGNFTPIICGRVMEGKYQSWLSVEFHEDDKSFQLLARYTALIQAYYYFIITCMLKISAMLRQQLDKPNVTYADYISQIGQHIDPLRFGIDSGVNTFLQIVMDFISMISSSPLFEKLFNMMRPSHQIQQFVSLTRNHTIFTSTKSEELVDVNNTNVKTKTVMFPVHSSIVKLYVDGTIKVIHYARVGCTPNLLINIKRSMDLMNRKCNGNVFSISNGDDEDNGIVLDSFTKSSSNKRKRGKEIREKSERDSSKKSKKKKSSSAPSSSKLPRKEDESVYLPSDDSDVDDRADDNELFDCFDVDN